MLHTILSVSGKSGLFKMITQGKSLLIIESLTDKKRIPSYTNDKIIALGNVEIFTNDDKVPLYKVLNSIKKKENLQKIQFDVSKATPDELRTYLNEVLPEFDRERVYPTDIKRLLNWYNILMEAGLTEFDPEEDSEEQKNKDDSEAEDEVKNTKEEIKKEATPKKTATNPKTSTHKKTTTPTKQQPATGRMRQRTKQK